MNILITTLGTSWPIVPELLGFTNPLQCRLWAQHQDSALHQKWRTDYTINPVDEIWIITTQGKISSQSLKKLFLWEKMLTESPHIKTYMPAGVSDLGSLDECEQMRELIYRCLVHANERVKASAGKLYLSLAGGRKTMSADMFTAADYFGCDALLHVVDLGNLPQAYFRDPDPALFAKSLPADIANRLSPIVIHGQKMGNAVFQLSEGKINPQEFPLNTSNQNGVVSLSPDLLRRVEKILEEASNLHINFTQRMLRESSLSNFHALYSLSPQKIDQLQQERLGISYANVEPELQWLRCLPKTELHCHFGGLLSPQGILKIATAHQDDIDRLSQSNADMAQWIKEISTFQSKPISSLPYAISSWKKERDRFGTENRHLTTSAFILNALVTPERIAEFIFRDYLNEEKFHAIGIDAYETLGDLQGSSLLQSEKALRLSCQELIETCLHEHIIYAELRMSPLNCCLAGLRPLEMIRIVCDELAKAAKIRFKLIFIASRHGKYSKMAESVELVQEWKRTFPDQFKEWFAGFDLAGAEHQRSPKDVRSIFEDIMKDCLNITIHAGEGEDVENIWEAVYELNADRIGHGLTLADKPELLRRFQSRKIALELCPSSNDQIIGYRHFLDSNTLHSPIYPLKDYLNSGIRISLNTDDPGMSRTTLSQEYLKAAQMTENGLSKWEILSLIRNGFKSAFLSPDERKELILTAEKEIMQIVS